MLLEDFALGGAIVVGRHAPTSIAISSQSLVMDGWSGLAKPAHANPIATKSMLFSSWSTRAENTTKHISDFFVIFATGYYPENKHLAHTKKKHVTFSVCRGIYDAFWNNVAKIIMKEYKDVFLSTAVEKFLKETVTNPVYQAVDRFDIRALHWCIERIVCNQWSIWLYIAYDVNYAVKHLELNHLTLYILCGRIRMWNKFHFIHKCQVKVSSKLFVVKSYPITFPMQ